MRRSGHCGSCATGLQGTSQASTARKANDNGADPPPHVSRRASGSSWEGPRQNVGGGERHT